MSKNVVYVCAGHGGKDNGAVAYGMREDEITLVMAKACEKELKRHGVEVIMGRTTDVELTFEQEVAPANEKKAAIAIFPHVNASKNHTAYGAEVFYYPGSEKGKKLAELCLKHIGEIGQNINRGVKEGTFYVLKYTDMPAILPEAFFIDNDKDNDIGDTKAEQEAFGVAYAKSALEYLGIKYIPLESVKKPVEAPKKEKGISVLDWQKAAIKDGFRFPKYGADGLWGAECELIARQAVVMWRSSYIYKNLTKLVQSYLGIKADGLCGEDTDEAISKWQKKNGLTADGAVGINSWKKMLGV